VSARSETGWRWFKWAAMATLFATGIKTLFALGNTNSPMPIVDLALVGGVSGIVVFGGIAYLIGWCTGSDSSPEALGISPPTYSSAAPDMSAIESTYDSVTRDMRTDTVDEEAIYVSIAAEIENGNVEKGLWTRLFAECGGDENWTKVLYIRQRATTLIQSERLQLAEGVQATDAARQEQKRQDGLSVRDRLAAAPTAASVQHPAANLPSSC
jgi:hypothetical protein